MLPDWLDKELWTGFCEMRKEMGKRAPFTKYAQRLILDKLQGYHELGYDANESLRISIERGWRGVFPQGEPKRSNGGATFRTDEPLSEHMQIINWAIEESHRTGKATGEIIRQAAIKGPDGWRWKPA